MKALWALLRPASNEGTACSYGKRNLSTFKRLVPYQQTSRVLFRRVGHHYLQHSELPTSSESQFAFGPEWHLPCPYATLPDICHHLAIPLVSQTLPLWYALLFHRSGSEVFVNCLYHTRQWFRPGAHSAEPLPPSFLPCNEPIGSLVRSNNPKHIVVAVPQTTGEPPIKVLNQDVPAKVPGSELCRAETYLHPVIVQPLSMASHNHRDQ